MNKTPPMSSAADSTIPVMPLSDQSRLSGQYPTVVPGNQSYAGRWYACWLLGLPSVYPPTEEGDLIVRPCLIAGHRAVFQPSQDGVGMLRYVVTLPEIELRNVQHG